jgi:hypothetical protein
MLQQVAHFNDLSPKLRQELEDKIKSFGKKVRYRFNISSNNPDPEKYNGPTVWPQMYVLDPITFDIVDPYEDRPGKSKQKKIGMVETTDEKGLPTAFHRIRVHKRHQGIVLFEIEDTEGVPNIEDQMSIMYLELHPKLNGGRFANKNQKQIISRIDEKQEAKEGRERRTEQRKALSAATAMTEKEVKDFASAMLWDEHEEMEVLRDKVEAMAETNPELFNDVVEGKNIEYRSTIKRALDKQLISYNPAEFVFIWTSNQQKIVSLGAGINGENEVERFADWCMTNGIKGDEVYKKIKALVKV